jgi:hypothetical protein
MTTPLTAAGASTAASRFAPLYTNRFITGLWTQRNPLRDAAVPYLYEKSYAGSRIDSLLDGLNIELTSRLTLRRRRGHSVYNSQNYGPINRYYSFRRFSGINELINVMADEVAAVYDATGPATRAAIFNKTAGAGPSFFQEVGNILYFGNGVDQKKWIQSAKSWTALHTFASGDFLVDTNNNLQVAMGARTANISNAALTTNVVTLTYSSKVTLKFFVGMHLTIAGITTAAYVFLNGTVATITGVNYNQVTFALVHADVASASCDGTTACAGGNTGAAAPAWGTNKGDVTFDGSEQWLCKGSSVQNWGIAAPTAGPSAVNATRPSPYPAWAANTVYSASLAIVDGNGNVQQLTTAGTTAAAEPVWSVVVGNTTADGTAVWTNLGSATRAISTAYALNRIIKVTWSYWVTVPGPPCFSPNVPVKTPDGDVRFDALPAEGEFWILTEMGKAPRQAHDARV